MYHSFENLEVWKLACKTATDIYADLKGCKDFGLKDQITRSGVSIASNIAEGAERDSPKEFIRFLNIAKGSAAELRTQVYIARQIGVLDSQTAKTRVAQLKQLSVKLHALTQSIRRNTPNIKEAPEQYDPSPDTEN